MNVAFSTRLRQELLGNGVDLVKSAAYHCAIREVADAESQPDFSCTRAFYTKVGRAVEAIGLGLGDGEFAEFYLEVARRTIAFAETLTD